MSDLSVLIPARNEEFLSNTIDDIQKNKRADTDIIVVLDGYWPDKPIPQQPNLTVIHRPVSIGQRAATNEAARVSTAPYVMKLDAHCALGEGFDTVLLESAKELGPSTLQVPGQYNLHVWDWKCTNPTCKHRQYQDPPGKCPDCGWERVKDIIWKPRKSRYSTAWRFDRGLKFQYWGAFKHTPQGKGPYSETLSLLGACWFVNREHFWELEGLDEGHGGWGQMGTELSMMYWLSGGRVVTNHKTWFGHLFRVGGIGFPYPLKHHQTEAARKYSREKWLSDKWPHAKHKFGWLVEKFNPPGWEDWRQENASGSGRADESGVGGSSPGPSSGGVAVMAAHRTGGVVAAVPSFASEVAAEADAVLTKGIVYYSDCRPDPEILNKARAQLARAVNGIPIVSSCLEEVPFGTTRIVHPKLNRGHLTMFKQILAGLVMSDADIIFLAEHDILYHPSHFDFTPEREDVFYYNRNTWKVDANDGKALFYLCDQTSGLCARRDLLLQHYRKRVERVAQEGFTRKMGFEPGTHNRAERVDDYKAEHWMSEHPNIDLRHGHNLTQSRWSQDKFRNPPQGWKMADEVPGWGRTKGRMQEFLKEVTQ